MQVHCAQKVSYSLRSPDRRAARRGHHLRKRRRRRRHRERRLGQGRLGNHAGDDVPRPVLPAARAAGTGEGAVQEARPQARHHRAARQSAGHAGAFGHEEVGRRHHHRGHPRPGLAGGQRGQVLLRRHQGAADHAGDSGGQQAAVHRGRRRLEDGAEPCSTNDGSTWLSAGCARPINCTRSCATYCPAAHPCNCRPPRQRNCCAASVRPEWSRRFPATGQGSGHRTSQARRAVGGDRRAAATRGRRVAQHSDGYTRDQSGAASRLLARTGRPGRFLTAASYANCLHR